MTNHSSRIKFWKDERGNLHIDYHCGKCNSTLEVTKLVEALCKYGQDDCPFNLYQAWKVLRLGTSEYVENKGQPELEHQILKGSLIYI